MKISSVSKKVLASALSAAMVVAFAPTVALADVTVSDATEAVTVTYTPAKSTDGKQHVAHYYGPDALKLALGMVNAAHVDYSDSTVSSADAVNVSEDIDTAKDVKIKVIADQATTNAQLDASKYVKAVEFNVASGVTISDSQNANDGVLAVMGGEVNLTGAGTIASEADYALWIDSDAKVNAKGNTISATNAKGDATAVYVKDDGVLNIDGAAIVASAPTAATPAPTGDLAVGDATAVDGDVQTLKSGTITATSAGSDAYGIDDDVYVISGGTITATAADEAYGVYWYVRDSATNATVTATSTGADGYASALYDHVKSLAKSTITATATGTGGDADAVWSAGPVTDSTIKAVAADEARGIVYAYDDVAGTAITAEGTTAEADLDDTYGINYAEGDLTNDVIKSTGTGVRVTGENVVIRKSEIAGSTKTSTAAGTKGQALAYAVDASASYERSAANATYNAIIHSGTFTGYLTEGVAVKGGTFKNQHFTTSGHVSDPNAKDLVADGYKSYCSGSTDYVYLAGLKSTSDDIFKDAVEIATGHLFDATVSGQNPYEVQTNVDTAALKAILIDADASAGLSVASEHTKYALTSENDLASMKAAIDKMPEATDAEKAAKAAAQAEYDKKVAVNGLIADIDKAAANAKQTAYVYQTVSVTLSNQALKDGKTVGITADGTKVRDNFDAAKAIASFSSLGLKDDKVTPGSSDTSDHNNSTSNPGSVAKVANTISIYGADGEFIKQLGEKLTTATKSAAALTTYADGALSYASDAAEYKTNKVGETYVTIAPNGSSSLTTIDEIIDALNKAGIDVNTGEVAEKSTQTIEVAKKSRTLTLKKGTTKTQKARYFKMGATAETAVTTAKKSGSSRITVKGDKVTLKKGTKKGTYTAKVTIKAAASAEYLAATKTITVKFVVKK